jgi:hypothetical protein
MDLLDQRGGGHLRIAAVGTGTELRPGALRQVPQHQAREPGLTYGRERQPALPSRHAGSVVSGQATEPL